MLQAASPNIAIIRPYVYTGHSMPFLHWFLSNDHPIAYAMRERGLRLLNVGDTPLPSNNAVETALTTFIAEHPLWAKSAACMSLLSHQKLASAVISRVQRSGMCFLHAAIVGLHYLVNFHSETEQRSVVDIRLSTARHGGRDVAALPLC